MDVQASFFLKKLLINDKKIPKQTSWSYVWLIAVETQIQLFLLQQQGLQLATSISLLTYPGIPGMLVDR